MIPPFKEHGDLPPGVHACTWAEFEARFSFSARRRELLRSLTRALGTLRRAGVLHVWVGGSFVTTKEAPGDVDLCWECTPSVDPAQLDAPFWNGNGLAGTADLGALDVMPEDPELGLVRMVLSHDREGRPRGIVLLHLESARVDAGDATGSGGVTDE
jgi:hypothetical protein